MGGKPSKGTPADKRLNAVNMTANDYTNQTAADVLRDCGLQAQKQWFVYYDESQGKPRSHAKTRQIGPRQTGDQD